ncbi:hypothetical protein PH210_23890 [Paenibacillus sp. BSR1-1]|uniref:hypothetical protein n=1 Tax=Paenibacillus sp. BSR1-1 TaxID=3020845 RepID=UPI0025AF973D|nr:hypothetical protein [Paenibacillus sp. BSR1-1]MDN3019217.1 hypothetical protein [Paenibacillus sp. BSR1-1]
MKKLFVTIFTVAFLLVGISSTSEAATKTGWVKSAEHWFYYQSGHLYKGWLKSGNSWYYMDSSGVMKTGWVYVNKNWYYLNTTNGAMKTGWVNSGGKWYYLNSSGAMKTGWFYTGGKWYYLNSSGAMLTGWQTIGGKQYYLYPSGAMASNTTVSGKTIGSDGVVVLSKVDKALESLKSFGATVHSEIESDGGTLYNIQKGNINIGFFIARTSGQDEGYEIGFVTHTYTDLAVQLALDLGYNGTVDEIKSLINKQNGPFDIRWNTTPVQLTAQLTKAINDVASSGAIAKLQLSNEMGYVFNYYIFKNNQYIGQIYELDYLGGQISVNGNVQYADLLETVALDLGIPSTSDHLKTYVQKVINDPSYIDYGVNYQVRYSPANEVLVINWNL